MRKNIKKSILGLAAVSACALVGTGILSWNGEIVSAAADAESFKVASVALRVPDETYGKGLRFKIVMSADDYANNNVASLTTGVLLIPNALLGESELTIDLDNENVVNKTGSAWKSAEDGSMEMYVHVYNIDPEYYATNVTIRAYVDDNDPNTAPIYSTVSSASVAYAANYAYNNDVTLDAEEKAALQESYLTYDVNYYVDNELSSNVKGVYAQTIEAPTSPEKTGYTFAGWWNKAQTAEWDFATTTISGVTTNLYAKWDIVNYSAKVIRANGKEETVNFTVEDRAEKLAAIALTANNAQYTYSWVEELPTELALNNDQVFTETSTVNTYTVTLVKNNGEGNETLNDVEYGTTAQVLYTEMVPTYAGRTFDGWYVGDVKVAETDIVESDLTLTAKWTVADKITLIDAATESDLFSNTYVASTDAIGQMGWGADKGTTYATTTDATYGSVIETNNAKAYIMGWINFNTGVEGDLKSYWDYKLAGLDKIVFYVYNGTALPHAISVKSADGALGCDWITLNANGWTKIELDTDVFVGNTGAFANIAVAGNAYIKIHFKNADGSNNGGPGDTTFKFSSFYGYTEKGYKDEFLKTATVLDADADFDKFAVGRGGGYWVDLACATQATFAAVDTEYGRGMKMTVTSNSSHGAYIDFNSGVTDVYAYWSEKLAGLDKLVFYYYNGGSVSTSLGFRSAGGSTIHSGTTFVNAAGQWMKVVIDVNTLLTNLQSNSATYLMFADTGSVALNNVEMIVTNFVGYTNAAYAAAFPTA